MAVHVPIQPTVFDWARTKIALTDEELVKKFPKFKQWESGEAEPTLKQAREFAKLAHIPFGRLLMSEPSGEDVGVPDFRTVRNRYVDDISPNLREVIVSAQNRLGWYSDFSLEVGVEPPEIVGLVPQASNPSEVARLAREHLGLGHSNAIPGRDKVSALVGVIEESGILVSRNSIVGNATNRPLDVEEFRGFTLLDDGFGLIFVNTRDAKAAQLFSLAHELGHIVRGQAGISDDSDQVSIESWCNRFASAFIAPEALVRKHFDAEQSVLDNTNGMAVKVGLSREALVLRLVEIGLAAQGDANELIPLFRASSTATDSKKSKGGPSRPVLVKSRVGKRFFKSVVNATKAGMLPEQDAARFLGAANYDSFQKLIATNGAVG
ncbi:ImmA/IrrE family metallo-endopeptidase [Corynebacterium sp. L4756]|uniref:ImmA/IrrE family metallo-endopeptidase n=1 Tax=unclassified Corynebacterium TaxID=2624378 RepID=UPI00374D2002